MGQVFQGTSACLSNELLEMCVEKDCQVKNRFRLIQEQVLIVLKHMTTYAQIGL